MSNISTFGTYTIARLGIYASQKALNVTGNNIANINTKGYARQTVDQYSLNTGGGDRNKSSLDTRIGSGALVQSISQLRDQYIDVRYRVEQANVGYSETRENALNTIASVLDEVGDGDDGEGVLEARFEEMVQMMQELNTKGAGKDDFDTLFRSAANSVIDTLHNYAARLDVMRDNEMEGMRTDIDNVNSILTRIQDLNASIRRVDIYNGNSLEQRDERNLLIDELSKYIKIDVTTEREQLDKNVYVDKLVIKTDNVPQRTLVDGIYATQLSIRASEGADGEMVEDPDLNLNIGPLQDVYGRRLVLSDSSKEEEGDESKALEGKELGFVLSSILAAREEPEEYSYDKDDKIAYAKVDGESGNSEIVVQITRGEGDSAQTWNVSLEEIRQLKPIQGETMDEIGRIYETNYKSFDVVSPSSMEDEVQITAKVESKYYGAAQLGDQELYGSLQARREMLTKQGVFSTAEQLEADSAADSKHGYPYYQKSLDVLASTFAGLLNSANLADGMGDTRPLFSNDGSADTWEDPPITASNISISKSWANGSLRVTTTATENGDLQSTASDNLTRILNLITTPQQFTPQGGRNQGFETDDEGNTLYDSETGYPIPAGGDGKINGDAASKDVFFTGSFQEFFTQHLSGGLGMEIKLTQTMKNNYEKTADDLYVDRDSVMGVDLNDEAMNMMTYEKSYSAACRLLTTYDSMLDKLINGTAV